MDQKLLAKLQRDGALTPLPGGKLGVEVILQYRGQLPYVTRAESRAWLQNHFTQCADSLVKTGLDIPPVSPSNISLSAQSLSTIVPLEQLDKLSEESEKANLGLDLSLSQMAELGT